MKDIAKELNVSQGTVGRWLVKFKLVAPNFNPRSEFICSDEALEIKRKLKADTSLSADEVCKLKKKYRDIVFEANKHRYYARRKQAFETGLNRRNRKLSDSRELRLEKRKKILEYYGGVCVCCGEDDYRCLALDHIHNDGKQHRKEIRNIYDWVIENNYPEGKLQVLCCNCNMCKYWNKGDMPEWRVGKNKREIVSSLVSST